MLNKQRSDELRSELQDLFNRTSDELTPKDNQNGGALLNEYHDFFASFVTDLGATNLVRHKINTGNAMPRRTHHHLHKWQMRTLTKCYKKELIIEPSIFPWVARID